MDAFQIIQSLILLSSGQGRHEAGAYPGNAAMEAGIHPEWDAGLSQGTIHAHPHTRSFTSSLSNPPTYML